MDENDIGTLLIAGAIAVHRGLGPGLLESVYELALAHELAKRGLSVERQVAIDVEYDGVKLEAGFRADLRVESVVIVELKSVERISPAHRKQIQTYLRLSGCKLGYLLNFGAPLMRDGIVRAVNGL